MHSRNLNDLEKADLTETINHLLRRLFHEHLLTFNDLFHDIQLFDGQQRIIFHLLHHEGDNQSNIAKLHGIKKATVNKAISSMEEKGLLYKVKDENKKRAFKLFLTEKGFEMKGPIENKINELQDVILEGFSKDDQKNLKEYLIKMIHNLNDYRKASTSDNREEKTKIRIMIKKEKD